MNILSTFILRILKSASLSKKEVGQMSIIVQRPYSYLLTELQRVFDSQEDVNVKLDRRYDQRRTKKELVTKERRRAERRRKKEMLVEVVILK